MKIHSNNFRAKKRKHLTISKYQRKLSVNPESHKKIAHDRFNRTGQIIYLLLLENHAEIANVTAEPAEPLVPKLSCAIP